MVRTETVGVSGCSPMRQEFRMRVPKLLSKSWKHCNGKPPSVYRTDFSRRAEADGSAGKTGSRLVRSWFNSSSANSIGAQA